MRLFLLIFGAFSSVFASMDVQLADTDFLERAINFIIFVAILWFLVAKKAKAFFAARRNKIAERLLEVQEKLKQAKKNKEQALRKLEEAKEVAAEIIANAKREAYMIAQKMEEQSSVDIENMIKNTENLMEIERKKMEKEVVSEILEEVFKESKINAAEYVKILEKKVV
ncbi:F0F1 ATP synthase subunit B [Helicobacter anatolicus]|uniref:F0F1 ATP synthase subunit B n=1 Tax=Helicobacter anatolicus TaxID=2905874 RepID=UPI001E5E5322|nr:F0F1 ATP synthase subunit B [Helicobacter anatolicus]MCE3037845.1 F0F1 ATP synthase subunit B [Helicobacter anatolicus]